MLFDPEKRRRHSIRLRGYDYRQAGAYFVTIVTKARECLFGEVVAGFMHLNDTGRSVATAWEGLSAHYPHVDLDAFVVMPNHVHGIVVLTDQGVHAGSVVGAGFKPALAPSARHSLAEIIRALKTFSGRRINVVRDAAGTAVWQRGYHEHIIRDVPELERLRRYIEENPLRWTTDEENPGRVVV